MTVANLNAESIDQRAALGAALLDVSLKLGEGLDKNGQPYQWMVDSRELLLSGPWLQMAARLIWERIKPYKPEMVGGMTLAANPLTIAVMYESRLDGMPVDAFLIRKQPKEDGLRKLIEGPPIKPGTRVVVLDDIVNSGDTQKAALKALEPTGATVVAVGALIDCERTGAQWLKGRDIALEALFTLSELGIAQQVPARPESSRLLWTLDGLNRGSYQAPKSTPCFGEGAIFLGSDRGLLLSLDLEGQVRWHHAVRDTERGVHSSPALYKGRVYAGAYDGYLYCLSAESGELVWEERPGQWIGSSPAVDEVRNRLYVGIEYGEAGGSLIAVDPDDGRTLWELKANGYMHGSPCLDAERGQVIAGANDGVLFAADAETGAERWRFTTDGAIKGKAAVDDEGRCFTGSFDGNLYALSAENGALLWKRRVGHRLYTTPLVCRDLVIVGSYASRLVALDRRTGRVRWVASTGGALIGGAALVGDDRVAVGSADGCFYLFEAATGRTLYQYRTGAPIMGTPAVGHGQALVPSFDGKLYAFDV